MLRRIFRSILALALIGALCTRAHAYEAELQSLAKGLAVQMEGAGQRSAAVVDFADLQGTPNEVGRFLAQELSTQLVSATRQVSVVDRANLQVLLRENNLSMEGLVNPSSSRKLGNLIGIDTVILGTVTQMGDSIRLSVRAVSVETGRIVVSQSTNLPPNRSLTEMFTRGVAASPNAQIASNSNAAQPKTLADPRDRLRGDSLRVTGKEVVVSRNRWQPTWLTISAIFTIENLSGMGFEASLVPSTASIGGCPANDSTGLPFIGLDYLKFGYGQPVYLPQGGRLTVTIMSRDCPTNPTLIDSRTTDITASITVKTGQTLFNLPINASQVPIRVGGPQ
jgi:curli biogenesis system outer membrane secretion channel CsgG